MLPRVMTFVTTAGSSGSVPLLIPHISFVKLYPFYPIIDKFCLMKLEELFINRGVSVGH